MVSDRGRTPAEVLTAYAERQTAPASRSRPGPRSSTGRGQGRVWFFRGPRGIPLASRFTASRNCLLVRQ